MPSTYTVNLGIEKPATGEQSGTWGDTTNVNFDILDQAINGAERVTLTSAGSSGSPNALNITNGATSDGRNKWIEFYSSGDLGGSAYVQLVPDDAEKIVFIRNSLASSRSVLLFQGTYNSGRDLEIPAGVDMVVKFDGGGASAATVTDVFTKLRATEITTPTLTATTADINGGTIDNSVIGGSTAAAVTGTTVVANTSLNIAGDGATVTGIKDEDDMSSNSATKLATQQSIKAYVDSQVGTVDTWAEVLANGATSGSTNPEVTAGQALKTNTINETSAGSGVTIDSVLLKDDVVNATDVETGSISANDGTASATIANSTGVMTIASSVLTTTDINGGSIDGTNIGASSAGTGAFTTLSASSTFTGTTATLTTADNSTQLTLISTDADATNGPILDLKRDSSSPADNDVLGLVRFLGENDADGALTYARIFATIRDASNGTEDGMLSFNTVSGGANRARLELDTTESVFNEGGADLDFRVESDGNANMLFVDGGNDAVGIGTSSAGSFTIGDLVVGNGVGGRGITIFAATDNESIIRFADGTSGDQQYRGQIKYNHAEDSLNFHAAGASGSAENLILKNSEAVFNEGSIDTDFRVESDGNASMLFVDAGTNRVGIAKGSPEYPLDVTGVIQSGDQISVSGSRNFALDYSNGNIATIGGYYGSGGLILGYGVWPKSGAGSFVSSSSVALSRQAIHLNGYDFDMYSGTNQTVAADSDVSLDLHAKLSGLAGYVFNEASADIDFRVESNGNTHALFVDGGNEAVLVGKSTTALATAGLAFGTAGFASLTRDGAEPLNINRLSDDGKLAVFYKDGTEIGSLFTNGGAFVMKGNSASAPIQIQTVDGNEDIEVDPDGFIKMETAGSERLRINVNGSVGIGVADGDVTSDGNAARTYVGIIGTANRGRLNLGSTASNGADAGTLAFTNGANTLADISVDTTAGVQNTGTMYVNGTRSIKIQAAASDEVIFNEGSSDTDFRVESNDNANMFFMDGGANRVNVGGSGSGQVNSAFYVEGRTTLYNGSTTGGSVLLTDGYTPATDDHLLNLGTQRSSGGPFLSYGLGQFQNADGLWKSTYDNFSGAHSVFVLNGRALQFFADRSNNQTTVGDTVTVYQMLMIDDSESVFNNDSLNQDFRVESDNDSHALFLDAANDQILIGNTASTQGEDYLRFDARPGTSGHVIISGRDDTSTKNHHTFVNPNGVVGSIQTAGSATAYNTSSDARLKENIADADDAGELIDAIQVRQFDWIVDGEHQRYGMVAQELNTVAPEAVSKGETEEDMMAVDYSKLVPMLIKEIQSLRARVADLES